MSRYERFLLTTAALLFVGCGSNGQGNFSVGVVDIGNGRRMYRECRGVGTPPVILIAGKGNRADIWNVRLDPLSHAPTVLREVGAFTRVCAYDRPGTTGTMDEPSRSDPAPEPVTAADGVADLHALLAADDERGPYVLVGHSYGGLISRLYASTYPEEAAGLVLVDALAEGLYDGITPEQRAVFETINFIPERIDNLRTFAQLRAAPPVAAIPVIVLTADKLPITARDIAEGKFPPIVTQEFADALWAAQVAAQDGLAALFPAGQHIKNTNSGHYIQLEQPQLVIDSIRQVVDDVRNLNPAVDDSGR